MASTLGLLEHAGTARSAADTAATVITTTDHGAAISEAERSPAPRRSEVKKPRFRKMITKQSDVAGGWGLCGYGWGFSLRPGFNLTVAGISINTDTKAY